MRTHGGERDAFDEIGRAAFELGRSQLTIGQDAQATENLRLACGIAKVRSDGLLYAPALAHLVQVYRICGDGAGVEAILAEARVWLPQLVGDDSYPAFAAAVAG